MRPEAIFSFLFACVACALQLQEVKHRDRLSSTERLASEKFSRRNSMGPSDIVIRRNTNPGSLENLRPLIPLYHQKLLHLARAKCCTARVFLEKKAERVMIQDYETYAKVYRVNFFRYPVIVKEITMGKTQMGTFIESDYPDNLWSEKALEDEIGFLKSADQFFGRVVDGDVHYLLMKDMGVKAHQLPRIDWQTIPEGIEMANKRYRTDYAISRAQGTNRGIQNYVFWESGSSELGYEAHAVGSWRYAHYTDGEPDSPVPKGRHYCGIVNLDASMKANGKRPAVEDGKGPIGKKPRRGRRPESSGKLHNPPCERCQKKDLKCLQKIKGGACVGCGTSKKRCEYGTTWRMENLGGV